ncbi:MAG: PD-(D/E)XK nuclease family protein, partial [Treponema sp.]|nr:PD-(D/E)XK nuclease family protein [Treponema sp.]
TLLLIRRLVQEGKARWQDISLSVPDMDLYRPYLEREAERYCVPAVIHAGESLLKSSAAVVFSEIYNCYSSRFSYDSVRSLLLDAHIPWKKEFRTMIGNLVREGCQMHCVCQYDDRKDIWEESLRATSDRNERELTFYTELKKGIASICRANSFAGILAAWMIFKQDMLDTGDFSSESNLILGRCVEELKKLILVWEEYVEGTGLTLENPYEFFLSELKGSRYTPQNKSNGVRVYPYRLSAGAAFKYQLVIDASQSHLEIPMKRLSFLSPAKRQKLGLLEREKRENPSVPFIRLYGGLHRGDDSAYSGPVFSFAQNSFSGFAIAHSFLRPVECDASLDSEDFIAEERNWFLSGGSGKPFAFSGQMKKEALHWLEGRELPPGAESLDVLKKKVLALVMNRYGSRDDGKIRISQSDLKDFFPCQRYWLFNRLLKIDDDSLTAELSGPFDIGNINHKVLERFMLWQMAEKGRLPVTEPDGSFGDEEEAIYDKLRLFAEESIEDPDMDFSDSILSKLSFRVQKDSIARTVLDCLHAMCRPEEDKKLSFGGWGIFAAEKWFDMAGKDGKWIYGGKVDCILKDDVGSLAIVDYKSGKTPAIGDCIASEDGALGDFQMPMYVKLCEESGQAGDVESAAFYSIKDASATVIVQPNEKKGSRQKSVDRETFDVTMDAFSGYAESFYERLTAGELAPAAGGDDFYNKVDTYEDCADCSFKAVCRTAFRVSGRRLQAE